MGNGAMAIGPKLPRPSSTLPCATSTPPPLPTWLLGAEKTYFVGFLEKHGASPRQLLHRHQWLRETVAHRIADPIILEVIGKWLKAGAMVDGSLSKKIRNSIARGKIVTKGPCSLEIVSVSRRSAPARSRAAPA
jgi:hypothetical protein